MPITRSRVAVVTAAAATVLAVLGGVAVLGITGPSTAVTGSALAVEAGDGELGAGQPADPATTTWPAPGASGSPIKNVVLLLADDLDTSQFEQVPRLAALKQAGTYLSNFVVTDSLCCPSRTSIFRSQYVHNHKVLSNVIQTGGGWEKFNLRHLQNDCLPTWLKAAGVNTALVGKYLNGYPIGAPTPTYIPPGWDHFVTSISGNRTYTGYNYTLNVNGTLERHGAGPTDLVNDVLTADATNWLSTATSPFFLEYASYSPHTPAPVAAKNVGSHVGATAPRPPSFNAKGIDEPRWLRAVPSLGRKAIAHGDRLWERRLESAESVADSYDALVAQLKASGHYDDTLIIVTSDNGYHVGTHRLDSGKQTPYREDSIVPAVLIGPGVAQGQVIDRMTSTIDLAPTIDEIFGASTPDWTDGRSLLPLLQDPQNAPWRTGVLTENLAGTRPGDPDFTVFEPPFFHALRTTQWLYVEYGPKEVALYDLVHDPNEINNVARRTDPAILAQLHAQAAALTACAGADCRVADAMAVAPPPATAPAATASPAPTASPAATASATPTASPS